MVDGEEYGEVREYGKFSFTRMYQAGHEGKISLCLCIHTIQPC